jgi:hypothetical protein
MSRDLPQDISRGPAQHVSCGPPRNVARVDPAAPASTEYNMDGLVAPSAVHGPSIAQG